MVISVEKVALVIGCLDSVWMRSKRLHLGSRRSMPRRNRSGPHHFEALEHDLVLLGPLEAQLIMEGQFEAATAPAWVDAATPHLSNVQVVEFLFTGHDVLDKSQSAKDVMNAFLDDPTAPADGSCAAEIDDEEPDAWTVGREKGVRFVSCDRVYASLDLAAAFRCSTGSATALRAG